MEQNRLKLLKTGLLLFVVLNLVIASGIAWFTMSKESDLDHIGFESTKLQFELATLSTDGYSKSQYDTLWKKDGETVISEGSVLEIDGKKYSVTGEENKISWNMNKEMIIAPKENGVLSFYVIPKVSGQMEIQFSLDIEAYVSPDYLSDDAEINTNEEIKESENVYGYRLVQSDLLNMLKGHLMFFDSCSDGAYRYLLDDNGNLTFSKTIDAKEGVPTEVSIYWNWPYVLGNVLLNQDDRFQVGQSLLLEKSEKNNVILQMCYHSEWFFYGLSDGDKDHLGTYLLGIAQGSNSPDFSADAFSALSAGWNRADSQIGRNIRYISLTLTAQ